MSTLRLRRLAADFEKLQSYVERHPRLKMLNATGEPPEQYQIEYRIRSLRQTDDELTFVAQHTVEIVLPRDYPRAPPQCRMLTPVFHPNIAPHAICVGDHWSAGEPIGSIVARIGEMLAYQSYNTKSPLNGEAARWVEQNIDQLPLDKVNMLAESSPATVAASATATPGRRSLRLPPRGRRRLFRRASRQSRRRHLRLQSRRLLPSRPSSSRCGVPAAAKNTKRRPRCGASVRGARNVSRSSRFPGQSPNCD